MGSGPERAPRRRLSRTFRAALRADLRLRSELARLSGFPHFSHFSFVTNAGADAVRYTPVVVARLTVLANLLKFPPEDIFEPEGGDAGTGRQGDAFSEEHLPEPTRGEAR